MPKLPIQDAVSYEWYNNNTYIIDDDRVESVFNRQIRGIGNVYNNISRVKKYIYIFKQTGNLIVKTRKRSVSFERLFPFHSKQTNDEKSKGTGKKN